MTTTRLNQVARTASCLLWLGTALSAGAASDYAVVVSEKTQADPSWSKVVETLRTKHSATVITYKRADAGK